MPPFFPDPKKPKAESVFRQAAKVTLAEPPKREGVVVSRPTPPLETSEPGQTYAELPPEERHDHARALAAGADRSPYRPSRASLVLLVMVLLLFAFLPFERHVGRLLGGVVALLILGTDFGRWQQRKR